MKYIYIIIFILEINNLYSQIIFPGFTINDTYISGINYFSTCVGDTLHVKGEENGLDIQFWRYYVVTYDSITHITSDSLIFDTKDFSIVISTPSYFYIQMIASKTSDGVSNGEGYAEGIYLRIYYCPPHAYFKLSADTICQNTCVQIADSSTHYPTDWYWVTPNAATQQNNSPQHISACYADTGLFPITLIVSNPGGADTLTKYIYVTQAPTPTSVQLEYNIHYGDSVLLQACAVGNTYSWQANNIYICQNCDSILQFKPDERNVLLAATVHTPPACDVICNYNIITTGIPEDVLMPTAFSPNGDGINDLFGLAELSANRKLEYFKIYNRWGECVFETNNQYEKWDGTYKNTIQPLGVYVWDISIINKLTGNRKQMSGNATLLK
jgi:gliding motility-associated-like protein